MFSFLQVTSGIEPALTTGGFGNGGRQIRSSGLFPPRLGALIKSSGLRITVEKTGLEAASKVSSLKKRFITHCIHLTQRVFVWVTDRSLRPLLSTASKTQQVSERK